MRVGCVRVLHLVPFCCVGYFGRRFGRFEIDGCGDGVGANYRFECGKKGVLFGGKTLVIQPNSLVGCRLRVSCEETHHPKALFRLFMTMVSYWNVSMCAIRINTPPRHCFLLLLTKTSS